MGGWLRELIIEQLRLSTTVFTALTKRCGPSVSWILYSAL